MKLGERLAAIAAFVPQGAKLADIGTDHAYLPIALLSAGRINQAVAGEVNKGPYESAKAAIKQYKWEQSIQLRLGNGLEVIAPGEVDTVVIAGMGGSTIIDILTRYPATTESVETLILQPMVAGAAVRRWLTDNGWRISDENLVVDEGRIYEIIVAVKGQAKEEDPILAEIGPVLWAKRHPLLKEHLQRLINQTRRILAEMAVSPDASRSEAYRDYQTKLAQLEAKLQCL